MKSISLRLRPKVAGRLDNYCVEKKTKIKDVLSKAIDVFSVEVISNRHSPEFLHLSRSLGFFRDGKVFRPIPEERRPKIVKSSQVPQESAQKLALVARLLGCSVSMAGEWALSRFLHFQKRAILEESINEREFISTKDLPAILKPSVNSTIATSDTISFNPSHMVILDTSFLLAAGVWKPARHILRKVRTCATTTTFLNEFCRIARDLIKNPGEPDQISPLLISRLSMLEEAGVDIVSVEAIDFVSASKEVAPLSFEVLLSSAAVKRVSSCRDAIILAVAVHKRELAFEYHSLNWVTA